MISLSLMLISRFSVQNIQYKNAAFGTILSHPVVLCSFSFVCYIICLVEDDMFGFNTNQNNIIGTYCQTINQALMTNQAKQLCSCFTTNLNNHAFGDNLVQMCKMVKLSHFFHL